MERDPFEPQLECLPVNQRRDLQRHQRIANERAGDARVRKLASPGMQDGRERSLGVLSHVDACPKRFTRRGECLLIGLVEAEEG